MIKTNADKYLGQTRMMRCGMKATIIAYRNANDIDVQFENDIIHKHKSTGNFNQGRICPTPRKKNHSEKWIGQTRTMNCGLKTTIIAYRNNNNIDVQFENGIIRDHMTLNSFKKGGIAPMLNGTKIHYVGQTRTMNCGLKATVIAYRTKNDIDVCFENRTIRKHTTIQSFYNNSIAAIPRQRKNNYIGQTRIMNCGMKATIIAYRKYADIDVQFEDGSIKKHIPISSFKKGTIANTTIKTGTTRKMNCGLNATIINYKNCHDIDIKFEDGTVRQHVTFFWFNKGGILHPTNILFNTYKMKKVAFQFHDKTYFYVTYTENDSEVSEVMCIDDMKQKLPDLAH